MEDSKILIYLWQTDGETEGHSNLGTLELVPEHFK